MPILDSLNSLVSSNVLSLFYYIGAIVLLPLSLMLLTCFPFVLTVLSITRQAIGLQQVPSNLLLVSIAALVTFFIMTPIISESWADGISPLLNGEIGARQAILGSIGPIKDFMLRRADGNILAYFSELERSDLMMSFSFSPSLVLAFVVSELSGAFVVGFLVFLPFLIIDLVVAAVLMSVGMMMVPPAVVSLPFKLIFFVSVNGWFLLVRAMLERYN